jgi:hypothetical protein
MIKNTLDKNKISDRKQYKPLFLIGLMFCMVVLMISFTSAWTSDKFIEDTEKQLERDSQTKYGEYIIEKSSWWDLFQIWTKEEVKRVRLENNTDICINCLAEGEIDNLKEGKIFNNVEWLRSFDNQKSWVKWEGFINWNLYIENKNRYVEVPTYETVCINSKEIDEKNETAIQECSQVETGTQIIDNGEWELYDFNKIYGVDNFKWKLEGSKKGSIVLDWILVTSENVKLTSWAVWGNISLGDDAEVILNSPDNNSIQYTNLVTVNASVNVTGGAYPTNISLNLSVNGGAWEVKNISIVGDTFTSSIMGSSPTDVQNTLRSGIKFEANINGILTTVTKRTETTCNTAYLYLRTGVATGDLLSTKTFSGDVATFNYQLISENQYFLVCDNEGSNYNSAYSSPSLPFTSGNITILSRAMIGSEGDESTVNIRSFGSLNIIGATTSSTQTFTNTFNAGDVVDWNMKACDSDGDCGQAVSDYRFRIAYDAPEIEILNPLNNSEFIGLNYLVNFSANITGLGISNVTLNLYEKNGTIAQLISNSSGDEGIYNFSVELPFGEYVWNIFAINEDGNSHTSETRSFIIQPFEITGEEYETSIFETESQTFYVNISTINDIITTSINFVYNGTTHFVETNCISGVCELEKTIDTPLVTTGTSQNKSFFWTLKLFAKDGTIYSFNTTANEQNVSRIYLELTNATYPTKAVNFTGWNEKNRSSISTIGFAGTFDVWLGSGSVKRTKSFNVASASSIAISISENRTFYTDAFIEYDGVGAFNGTFNKRNYHFQNASLTNTTQDIKLFLLSKELATSFIQRVVDTSQIPQVGTLIFVQRYYPEDDTYETVSITKTDNKGESVGFYETEIPDYRHLITSDGTLLKITERGKVFPTSAPYTITFTIGDDLGYAWETFKGISNLISSLTYNKTTGIVTYTWIDTTGALSIARLLVEQVKAGGNNVVICNSTAVLTAGTMTCNVSNYTGSFNAIGSIGRSPEVVDKLITFVVSVIKDALAKPFVILWIIFLIGCVGAFMIYPPAGVVLIIPILGIGYFIGIISVSWLFVVAIISVAVWVLIEVSS